MSARAEIRNPGNDLHRHRRMRALQIHGLRRGLPGRLLLRGRELPRHPSGRMHRLRRVRAGMPGRRHQAGQPGRAGRQVAQGQHRVFQDLAEHHASRARRPPTRMSSRTRRVNSRNTSARSPEQATDLAAARGASETPKTVVYNGPELRGALQPRPAAGSHPSRQYQHCAGEHEGRGRARTVRFSLRAS